MVGLKFLSVTKGNRQQCCIRGAMRFIPTPVMDVLLKLPPLDINMREVALTTMIRLTDAGIMPHVEGEGMINRIWKKTLSTKPLLQIGTETAFLSDLFLVNLFGLQETTAEHHIDIFTE